MSKVDVMWVRENPEEAAAEIEQAGSLKKAIAARLEKALSDATGLDKWHRFGEGYADLREEVQKLIAELRG